MEQCSLAPFNWIIFVRHGCEAKHCGNGMCTLIFHASNDHYCFIGQHLYSIMWSLLGRKLTICRDAHLISMCAFAFSGAVYIIYHWDTRVQNQYPFHPGGLLPKRGIHELCTHRLGSISLWSQEFAPVCKYISPINSLPVVSQNYLCCS